MRADETKNLLSGEKGDSSKSYFTLSQRTLPLLSIEAVLDQKENEKLATLVADIGLEKINNKNIFLVASFLASINAFFAFFQGGIWGYRILKTDSILWKFLGFSVAFLSGFFLSTNSNRKVFQGMGSLIIHPQQFWRNTSKVQFLKIFTAFAVAYASAVPSADSAYTALTDFTDNKAFIAICTLTAYVSANGTNGKFFYDKGIDFIYKFLALSVGLFTSAGALVARLLYQLYNTTINSNQNYHRLTVDNDSAKGKDKNPAKLRRELNIMLHAVRNKLRQQVMGQVGSEKKITDLLLRYACSVSNSSDSSAHDKFDLLMQWYLEEESLKGGNEFKIKENNVSLWGMIFYGVFGLSALGQLITLYDVGKSAQQFLEQSPFTPLKLITLFPFVVPWQIFSVASVLVNASINFPAVAVLTRAFFNETNGDHFYNGMNRQEKGWAIIKMLLAVGYGVSQLGLSLAFEPSTKDWVNYLVAAISFCGGTSLAVMSISGFFKFVARLNDVTGMGDYLTETRLFLLFKTIIAQTIGRLVTGCFGKEENSSYISFSKQIADYRNNNTTTPDKRAQYQALERLESVLTALEQNTDELSDKEVLAWRAGVHDLAREVINKDRSNRRSSVDSNVDQKRDDETAIEVGMDSIETSTEVKITVSEADSLKKRLSNGLSAICCFWSATPRQEKPILPGGLVNSYSLQVADSTEAERSRALSHNRRSYCCC